MPVKFKKAKKNADNMFIELGSFPVISESGDAADGNIAVQNVSDNEMTSDTAKHNTGRDEPVRRGSVPKIPASFYAAASDRDDALSRELDMLAGQFRFDSRLGRFLLDLKRNIYADRTWLAFGRSGDTVYSLASSDSDIQNVRADNGLVAHAMSIDHLMFIKNKSYIDELVDNTAGLTSLFIVPVSKSDMRGMVLAGYRSPKGELGKIISTLNECRFVAAEYLQDSIIEI